MQVIKENGRNTPVAGNYDVIVAGGGPAGIAAALRAARLGARTKLIEHAGCLGGVWTSGLLSWVLDSENKTGLMAEIRDALAARNAAQIKPRGFSYDPEEMKVLLERLCREAGVDIRLYSLVCGAIRNEEGRLKGLITESKSGREAWLAPVLIDATGDGDLGALAGCSFDEGRPGTGETQPMTLVALLCGVQPEKIRPLIGGGIRSAKEALFAEFQKAGATPSYSKPTLFHIREDLYALSANHEYGVKATNANDLSRATLHARAELAGLIGALKELGDPWKDLKLIATGAQIGVREGRRLHGLYTVTAEDMTSGRRHEDSICRCTFGIDVHSTNKNESTAYSAENVQTAQPYDIPLRAIIAADVDGLLMAGRCISGDFLAHSSYRVTGNAVALGEAAGQLAAGSVRLCVSPREVSWKDFLGLSPGR